VPGRVVDELDVNVGGGHTPTVSRVARYSDIDPEAFFRRRCSRRRSVCTSW
jgi:hypothetical protein